MVDSTTGRTSGKTAALTVAEDSQLVRQVSVVVVDLHCVINVKHGTANRVRRNYWTTHFVCYRQ